MPWGQMDTRGHSPKQKKGLYSRGREELRLPEGTGGPGCLHRAQAWEMGRTPSGHKEEGALWAEGTV